MEDENKTRFQLIDELREMRNRVADLERQRTIENHEKGRAETLRDVENIAFEDLFNLVDIQHLQDLYARAFGVAALITRPDGTPITQPSNFTVLCSQFIRNTEKGSKNCNFSDALIGRPNPAGPIIQPCLSAGLCNAGASIIVGGRHIANWLIGQVRNENQQEEDMMAYARELGADEAAFRAAYRQVPIMSPEQFESVAQVLFVVVNQLSMSAYQNVQQARFITERRRIEKSLRLAQFIFDKAPIGIWRMGPDGEILDVNEAACASLGYTRETLCRMTAFDVAPGFTPGDWAIETTRLNDAGTITIEAFHQRKGGEIFPVQVIGKFMRFEGQAYHLAFVQDISDRKQNEDALREKDQLLHDIGKLVKIGAWKFDLETGKATSTDEVARICDFDPDKDVSVEKGLSCYHGVYREKIEHAFDDLVEKGISYDLALEIVSAKGVRKWVRTTGYPVMKDGRIVQVKGSFQDISEHKRLEQALKESEQQLELALSGANEGIWDWLMDEDVLYLDARFYTMAGYRPDEFPAAYDEILKRIHEDDLERVKSANDQYLAGRLDAFEVEFRFRRKDDSYMWIRAKGKLVAPDDEGNPTRFIGTHADITARKWAEEALRDNEQLLGNILESMNEGLLVLDRNFKCTLFNRSMGSMVETTKPAAIGNIPWDAFPPLKDTSVEKNIRKTMTGESGGNLEIQLPLPSGKMAWFRDSFSCLRNADGHIVGVVGVVSDITQQKQSEEELRHLKNYLSNIIDSMPSVLVGVDRDGRVTQWNRRAEQVTGVSVMNAQSRYLGVVFPRLMKQMDNIETAIRERRVITVPKMSYQLEQEAETRYDDITIFPLVASGEAGAVIRVDDVTQQVRLEEMMIQNEKMLSVGGLAAGMAHEVNNPLAGILQNASVLKNRLLGDLPANHKAAEAAGTTLAALQQYLALRKLPDMIDSIRESGSRAAAIVRNMLSFARKSDRRVSNPFLPPNRWARARGWGCPFPTSSSPRIMAGR